VIAQDTVQFYGLLAHAVGKLAKCSQIGWCGRLREQWTAFFLCCDRLAQEEAHQVRAGHLHDRGEPIGSGGESHR
jgi:hypothetical protein